MGIAMGQFSAERSALNNLAKGKWEKSYNSLVKAIRKDSLKPVARYGLSVYYFTSANPAFQLDSAYRYVLDATRDYQLSSLRDRERMRRFPLDSQRLQVLRLRIDSAAFERAKHLHTERDYQFFIDHFSGASQVTLAAELRDEVAYLDALKTNTYQAFLAYTVRYPQAARVAEASKRYHKLLYDARTEDHRLASYERFLREYPETPHRHEVEQHIFEIMTADGTPEAFARFIQRYPESAWVAPARQLEYYVLRAAEQVIPQELLTDSLKQARALEQLYLVPVLQHDRFGFIDATGREVIPPVISELPDDYTCGYMTDDVLVFADRVLARNGTVLFEGVVRDVHDLGEGFLRITSQSCVHVVHKSGRRITTRCGDDVRLIADSFLAWKQQGKWALLALTGRTLLPPEYDDILDVQDFIVLKKGTKLRLVEAQSLAALADQQPLHVMAEVDEVRPFSAHTVWVRKGEEQGVVNRNYAWWIPLGRQQITLESFGAQVTRSHDQQLYYWPTGQSQLFRQVRVNKPWVAAQDTRWHLLDTSLRLQVPAVFDSIQFIGPFAWCKRADSVWVYVQAAVAIPLTTSARVEFIPGRDSLYFLQVTDADKRTLFDNQGNRLVQVQATDRVEYAGEELLAITRKEKKGLMNLTGTWVLPAEYDALGPVQQQRVSLLKNKKFGLADLSTKREIKPVFDRNLVVYNHTAVVAIRDGLSALLDWNGKNMTPYAYDEIRYWNDSVALVKKGFHWQLVNFITNKSILEKIRDFRWVSNTATEKILIVHQENEYGVISNRKGIIIPPTFSDIVNLGSPALPLYFTEKHVEEASIYVVIYYDAQGKLLRRQVYETEDYERIYCADN